MNSSSEKIRLAAKEVIDNFSERARLIKMDLEEYEEKNGIDPGNDQFLDNDVDDDYPEDLYRNNGDSDYYSDESSDLPF